jgi:hypothetical protein
MRLLFRNKFNVLIILLLGLLVSCSECDSDVKCLINIEDIIYERMIDSVNGNKIDLLTSDSKVIEYLKSQLSFEKMIESEFCRVNELLFFSIKVKLGCSITHICGVNDNDNIYFENVGGLDSLSMKYSHLNEGYSTVFFEVVDNGYHSILILNYFPITNIVHVMLTEQYDNKKAIDWNYHIM